MTPLRKTSIGVTLLILLMATGHSPGASEGASAGTNAQASARARYGLFFPSDDAPATQSVLVVPGKEMDAEAVGRIIEDLTVMARIIEKNSANAAGAVAGARMGFYGQTRFVGDSMGPAALFSFSGRPKPLYVAGYGSLFFIRADFPLVPPPETEEQPVPAEQSDTVWAETKQSIFSPQTSSPYGRGDQEAPEPYSRERVDTLRSTLIATMKHATNIRALDAREWLTIVVQGTSAQPAGATPMGSSAFILRATKADVDLYAKGELSSTAFEQRVQTVAY